MARSRYYGPDGNLTLTPCEVARYLPSDNKFEVQWVHNGKRKLVSRLNLLFDEEAQSKFTYRVGQAKALRFAFEADIRYFLFSMETIDGNTLTTSEAVFHESLMRKRCRAAPPSQPSSL
eukprot:5124140-Prymnesium_polylepis.2